MYKNNVENKDHDENYIFPCFVVFCKSLLICYLNR